jgi:hypothetical protein
MVSFEIGQHDSRWQESQNSDFQPVVVEGYEDWFGSRISSLPDPGNAVGIELHDGTDDGNLFGQGLSHEQAVNQ